MTQAGQPNVEDREERLDAAVAAYLQAAEVGAEPDRHEWLARHPELAPDLERFLAGRSRLERVATPLRAAVEPGAAPPGQTLGDFRIVREVGRGGMGVVYEAEQTSLGRRVALKVLPFAATMDPRQLQRFHNEARAAAGLHHTNIVPVYGVGCERGVHYYAMQFIDGYTLADFIARQQGSSPSPVPTMGEAEARAAAASAPTVAQAAQATSTAPRDAACLRRVAEWGIQAAEALDCAHVLGVIHRDVKPANLLVDAAGRLWVTDFGLAQVLSDARLTRTGDLVGTLRYMSPEQALAKRVVMDHRTDVYSLGATLYELMTLAPAYPGTDRQELLRQIAFEEPVPPRLNKGIPAEVETIVLKALEKNPADRYATAQELADDLRSWLEDRPIQARRPSLRQVAARWARRHRPAVSAAALSLLAIVILTAAGLGWMARDRAARQRETERGATAALAQSETLLGEGDAQLENPPRWLATVGLAEAAVQRAEELLAAGEATEELALRVRQVREAVDAARTDSQVLAELERIQLEQAAFKEGHYDRAGAAPRYAAVLGGYGVDTVRPVEAAARVRHSRLREALLAALEDWWQVTKDAAEKQQLEAVLQAAEPAPDAFRARWRVAARRRDGAALAQMASEPGAEGLPAAAVVNLGRDLMSVKEHVAAERLLRAGQERYRSNFWLNHDLGKALREQKPPRPEEAVRYLTAALALRSDSPGVYLNLGNALTDKKDLEGAIREYQAALEIDPNFAGAHNGLGNALHAKKDLEGATREYHAALKIDPNFAVAHSNLGGVLHDKKDLEGAIREYRAALKIDPDTAQTHSNLGITLHAKKDLEGAIREHQAAIKIDPNLAVAHSNLGVVLRDKKDLEGAIRAFQVAIKIDPNFAEAHSNLGVALHDKKDLEGAIRAFQAALKIDPNFAPAHSGLGGALRDKQDLEGAIRACQAAIRIDPNYAPAHRNLGVVLADKKDLEGAIREYRAALKIDPNFAEAHNSLGVALYDKKDLEGAIREYRAALKIDPNFAGAHNNLGNALSHKKDLEGAIREYQAAIKIDPMLAMAHYNLGIALRDEKDLEGVIRAFQAALKIDPNFAEGHCNLGHALAAQGRFTDAVVALKAGHKLGSRRDGWPYPSALWVRRTERLAQFDARLSKILNGDSQPADAAERLRLARLCAEPYKQLPVAAVRFFSEAFAVEPKLADDLGAAHRYNAACAAALAGCGQGKDAGKLDDKERARLRRQALDWLQADLAARQKQLKSWWPGEADNARTALRHWQQDADFAGMRGAKALTGLPEAERPAWHKLWVDVADTLARAQGKATPTTKPVAK